MKERPILFSAPMVRALLDGSKTQTRRIVKAPVLSDVRAPDSMIVESGKLSARWRGHDVAGGFDLSCPYGQSGDRLYVRESFQLIFSDDWADGCKGDESACWKTGKGYAPSYPATAGVIEFIDAETGSVIRRITPSIHMPRWASRITLEIVSVRVERLQEISEADSIAEGIECHMDDGVAYYGPLGAGDSRPDVAYRTLWESINGKGSWDANPWVWVIEFKRIK